MRWFVFANLVSSAASRPDLGLDFSSDQRAVRRSFEPEALAALSTKERRRLRRELGRAVSRDVADPGALDALRLLLALHSLGAWGTVEMLPTLLDLPDQRADRAWAAAFVGLSRRALARIGHLFLGRAANNY